MRSWHGKLFFFAGFVCVLMLTSWHTSKSDNLPSQLHLVYERLLRAEQRGEVLSQELLKVLGQLQNRSIAPSNITISNSSALLEERVLRRLLPSQPNAHIYLPHLKEHEGSLKPIVHLGQRRTGDAVRSGVIEVISPSPHYYPDFSNLKETFGDPKERVRWRTKQNLDYSFLMLYAQSKGTYYVQLEDDIVAKQGFFQSMKKYIEQVLSEEWLFLEFSQLGFIGQCLVLSCLFLTSLILFSPTISTNATFVNAVVQTVQTNLPDAVRSGVIEVISPSPHYYPDFSNLKETFGDPKERVRWRTKQNLDYSFLMLYAQSKGTYYVQLEDDIVAKQGFFQSMKKYIEQVLSEEWLFLEFSQLGFIGKLFRTSDLPMIVEFFLMFHKDKPIDWLLDHILWVKVCNPEKDLKHCNNEKARLKRAYKPSLFQHVGLHSSLPGKIQNLKDKDFGNQVLFKGHYNPPAELSSSLEKYQSHTLERAYNGDDFFWGLTPKRGDYILITFTTPQAVKGYFFRSGNIETNGDRFYNTTVEVLPNNNSVKEKVTRGELACCKTSSDGFVQIGSFKNGVAEGEVDGALGQIVAMRLHVHSDSDVWVLLSEIFIKV
ncbi:alpha-1,3-mannosyl-glycoprotein 4-beta-N-acetylglucosaminyltransferase B-like [Sinocyclocheilus grahami]|uniref:alpha-1,3-mannosyl-glycoprotein 4-beta-N-acetylglucosaminyltransferase B-like n=1 Tax=Sinocyclocheilus grahami TaxID=75366 RepID=UPI0007AC659C|nr:PREDICTED: alpha-1,3-mannosyl-glycoprotein 4-beta-N-acetylglucosaminyltransferase B-like [Sinocyclocheilus grahami]